MLHSTWYKATTSQGNKYSVACCPDWGTVSIGWNGRYVDLYDWTERGLKALIESKTNEQVTSLVAC